MANSIKIYTTIIFLFATCFIFGETNLVPQIQYEKDCVLQGGICTMKDDCPVGYLTTIKGLCPKQKHLGVECCYAVPISAKSCRERGGECMTSSQCNNAPKISGKCPDSKNVCCALL